MKKQLLIKKSLLLVALFCGASASWADPVTLAQWDFSTTVKYSGTTTDAKTYYTARTEAYQMMEYAFSANQPFFYPTSGSLTGSTLTIMSSDTSKKWYISSYNDGALRMYTAAPTVITNPTLSAQHYNYAEVSFSATGYKNLQFSFKMSGNNGNTLPVYVLVSTDGGTTWYLDAGSYTTGNSWSNFVETTSSLGVDNCASVKVRALIGYHSGATSDMYMNNFKVTGEALNDATTRTLAVTPNNTSYGYVSMNRPGTSFVDGTSITLTGTKTGDYLFTKWNNGSSEQVSTDNPYTFSISSNTTLTAVFVSATYYTLTTAVNIPWAGTITKSTDETTLLSDTEVTLTAAANEGYTFSNWSTGATTASINVTMDGNKDITANFTKNTYDYGTTSVKVASWTFDGDYTTSAGEGVTIYTPRGVDHANYSSTYSAQKPLVRPDFYYGADNSDYALKIKCDDDTKTWKLENFNNSGRYVMSFDNGSFTTVTDYTVADQQKYYYEFSFPTTGFKDLSMSLSMSAHNEPIIGMTYGVVYSLDGTTWTSLGTVTTQISGGGSHWNFWNSTPNSIDLPAATANQDKVIIRIIRQRNSSGESGVQGQNNKLDYFTVIGTVSNQTTLDENTDYTPVAKTADVALTRTIAADKWSTIVLPFALTSEQITSAFGKNVIVAELTDKSTEEVLKFSTVTAMNANQPYAIKVKDGEYSGSATISGVTIVEGTSTQTVNGSWDFVGTYTSGNIPQNSYFFNSNKLYKAANESANESNTIKPFRAYFTPKGGAGARELKFIIDSDDTTSIGTIKADGTMETTAEGTVYNISGQRVNKPAKGLYVINGKKVIIK